MHQKLTVEELLLDESFLDYCTNKNSPHKAKWDLIHLSDPEQARLMEEAQELLQVLGPQLSAGEVTAEVDKFRQQLMMQTGENLQAFNQQQIRRRKIRRIAWASAGLAACIAMITFFTWPLTGKSPAPLAVFAYSTDFGERKQLQLPDGSKVILNSNTLLTYKADYNEEDRQLELLGEAYFEVAKDAEKKFIVHSNGFSTTAIGTAFYVHGRQPAQSYSVDLIEGKVSLQNGSGSPLLLQAGEAATWSGSGNLFDKKAFDTRLLRQWIEGKLTFQKADSREVLQHLAQWYGVEINDQRKKPGTITITGDYSDKPLEDILKAICFSLSCKYTIEENRIIIQ
jgi:transmembrane sensor